MAITRQDALRIGFGELAARLDPPPHPGDVFITDEGATWLVSKGLQVNDFLAGTGPIVRTGAAVRIDKVSGALLEFMQAPGAAPD
ncbi:MAG: hypothetical protein AB7P07_05855 [Hyphomonadaceae bacterium]